MRRTITPKRSQAKKIGRVVRMKRLRPKSEVQRGAMQAASRGDGEIGIPIRVANIFVSNDSGGRLPKRYRGIRKSAERGKARGTRARQMQRAIVASRLAPRRRSKSTSTSEMLKKAVPPLMMRNTSLALAKFVTKDLLG